MSDPTDAPAGAGATALARAPANEGFTTAELGNFLTQARENPDEPAESAEVATAEPESPAPKAETAAPEKEPGETTETTEPAELPPIEPPRSWTKEEKEEFATYPREAQEKISKAATRYESEFRRSQNEIADTRKSVEVEREEARKAKELHEAKARAYVQAVIESGPFHDITSMADLEKLQAEDPFRFQAYQLHTWKTQAAQTELAEFEQQKAKEAQSKWDDHVRTEDDKFAKSLTESDKARITTLMTAAPEFLEERGFKRQELSDMWNGKERLSLRDHRVQALILDGMKYRDLQNAPKAIAAKPAPPPVQRPGASKPAGTANSDSINKLSAQLERSGDTKDLGALIGAMRRA